MTYKFQCEDKDYVDWKVLHSKDLTVVFDKKITQEQLVDDRNQEVIKQFNNFDPVSLKLLNGDRFIFAEDGRVKINVKHSIIKSMKQIPGVLLLDKNQTYGRYNKRLLYRCIPDDKRMPEFLVPYEDKCKSFSKQKINKYVLFIVKEWTGKHPIAQLVNTIGSVDNYRTFMNTNFTVKVCTHPFKILQNKRLKNCDNVLNRSLSKRLKPETILKIDKSGTSLVLTQKK